MKSKLFLLLMFFLVFIRMAIAIPAINYPERFRVIDSDQYVDLATTLLRTGEYHGTLYPFPEIDLIRPPVYPMFLAFNIFLFSDVKWASLVQLLLTLLNAAVIYRIGLDLGQRKVGIAAALIYLLNISGAFEALSIMTETLTSTWILLAFWGLVQFRVGRKRRWLVVSGVMVGFGALTRPIVFPLLLIWGVLLLIFEITWKPFFRLSKSSVKNILIFLLSGMFLILPWQVRNYRVHSQFTLSDVSRVTVENYMLANVVAEVNGISRNDAVALIDAQPDPSAYRMQFVRDHPATFLRVQFRGILRTILAVSYPAWAEDMTGVRSASTGIVQNFSVTKAGLLDILVSNRWLWLGVLAVSISVIMYGMALIVIWRFATQYRREIVFPLVVIMVITIAYLMLSPLGQGNARFRVPAEPFLALLAGFYFFVPLTVHTPLPNSE